MGLFSRRSTARPDGEAATTTAPEPLQEAPQEPARGPWDSHAVPAEALEAPYVDLGSLRVPAVDGMQIRLESDRDTGDVVAVILVLGGSALELRVFAAPRSGGVWEELRADLTEELTRAGATLSVRDGDLGRELLATVPVRDAAGNTGRSEVRFVGVDGPRWFLRGAFQGRAATEPGSPLEDVLTRLVVARDAVPRPPRELLPLHAPGQGPAPEADDLPGLDPLEPGPTIAEVR